MELIIASETLIDAPLPVFWSVLTDLSSYHEWCPFTIRISGALAVGEVLTESVQMSPGAALRTQYVKVSKIDQGSQIEWIGTYLFEVFVRAVRTQSLTTDASGRTSYTNREIMRGLLVPVVSAMYHKELHAGFNAIGAALKERAEKLHVLGTGFVSPESSS